MAFMSHATRRQRRVTYTCFLRLPIAAKICSAAFSGDATQNLRSPLHTIYRLKMLVKKGHQADLRFGGYGRPCDL